MLILSTQWMTWRSAPGAHLLVKNFLGNNRAVNYKELIEKMLKCYHEIGANMSIRIHFLDSHLDIFPDNCGDWSDEQGERFHQNLKIMEDCYQGWWEKRMMVEYCLSIKQVLSDTQHGRKSRKRRIFTLACLYIFLHLSFVNTKGSIYFSVFCSNWSHLTWS